MTGILENQGSSRTRIERLAARVPPAEQPPRMNPFLRDMESASAFATAYGIRSEVVQKYPRELGDHPFQGREAVI